MTRSGILFLMIFGVGAGLGGCSSAMEYTSSIGDSEAYSLSKAITPKAESNRLIEKMTEVKLNHHALAISEIEAR